MIDEVHIQFQGGFAGRDCVLQGVETPETGYKTMMEFYPEDSNKLQVSFICCRNCKNLDILNC